MKIWNKAASTFNSQHAPYIGETRNRANTKRIFRKLAHKADRRDGKKAALCY